MKNAIKYLFLIVFSCSFSQTHFDQNGLGSSVIGHLSASGTQARQFEVAKIGYNSYHWQYGGIMIVELFESSYSTGYDKYFVSIGYGTGTQSSSPKIYHVESKGETHFATVDLGTPTDLASSRGGYVNKVIPLFINVRYYASYKVKITYLRDRVATVTEDNQIQINENPTPINIGDFSVTTMVENDVFSSGDLKISGTGNHYISNGNLGVGTTDTKGFKLGVQGKIAAEEVKVATYTNWADFVFENNYKLPTLKEVEQYIKEKGHLKDIPSAEEVKKDGFFLGEMDSKLLQKIEELTLYTIDQEKRIETLEGNNEKLEKENAILKSAMTKLELLQEEVNKLKSK